MCILYIIDTFFICIIPIVPNLYQLIYRLSEIKIFYKRFTDTQKDD